VVRYSSSIKYDDFSFSRPAYTDSTWQKAPVLKAKKSADPSVLFDAEDDFGDDDFGDFEEPEPGPTNATSPQTGSTGVSH
jgi:hypothetical protein